MGAAIIDAPANDFRKLLRDLFLEGSKPTFDSIEELADKLTQAGVEIEKLSAAQLEVLQEYSAFHN